jgi:hypothetical protein
VKRRQDSRDMLKRNFEIQPPKKCEDQFEEAERGDRKDNK